MVAMCELEDSSSRMVWAGKKNTVLQINWEMLSHMKYIYKDFDKIKHNRIKIHLGKSE